MKTLALISALLVGGLAADAQASGYGAAVIAAPVVQQEVRIRQRVRVRPIRQRFSVRHRTSIVAPVYAAPIAVQHYVAPVAVQQYVVPQAVVVPQVQQYVVPQVGCGAAQYVQPQCLGGSCQVF